MPTEREIIYELVGQKNFRLAGMHVLALLRDQSYGAVPWNVLDEVLYELESTDLYIDLVTELARLDSTQL